MFGLVEAPPSRGRAPPPTTPPPRKVRPPKPFDTPPPRFQTNRPMDGAYTLRQTARAQEEEEKKRQQMLRGHATLPTDLRRTRLAVDFVDLATGTDRCGQQLSLRDSLTPGPHVFRARCHLVEHELDTLDRQALDVRMAEINRQQYARRRKTVPIPSASLQKDAFALHQESWRSINHQIEIGKLPRQKMYILPCLRICCCHQAWQSFVVEDHEWKSKWQKAPVFFRQRPSWLSPYPMCRRTIAQAKQETIKTEGGREYIGAMHEHHARIQRRRRANLGRKRSKPEPSLPDQQLTKKVALVVKNRGNRP
eukprot:SAG31_NODE_286_length_18467_cov_41.317056_10_plen_308_part_00